MLVSRLWMPSQGGQGIDSTHQGARPQGTYKDDLSDAPLVLSPTGGFCKKEQIRATLEAVATYLGQKEMPTAHALRGIGAQAMVRAGMPVWKIQLFMRWGSSAVLGYLAEAPPSQQQADCQAGHRGVGPR